MADTNTMRAEESSLSSWAGPYVTEMLGRGQALAGLPYQAYMGPLTAGASPLQQQAFQGLASLTMPSTITGGGFSTPYQMPMPQQPMGQAQVGATFDPATKTITSTGTGRVSEGYPMPDYMKTDQAQPLALPSTTGGQTYTNEPFFANKEDYEAWKASQAQPQAQPQAQTQISATSPVSMAVSDFINNKSGMGFPAFQQAQPQAQIQAPAMPQAQPQGMTTQQQLASLMNPYLDLALQPQYAAAQRQADIAAQNLQSQYGKAGAYGGSRQGVAEAELQRGLLDRMAGITGQGYSTAYDKAADLLGAERRYGLDVLGAQQTGGGLQRAIEGQGIAADIAQFEQERDYPFKNVQFMQSLLQGLPLETQSYSYYEPSGLQSLAAGGQDIMSILDLLSGKS